MKRNLLLTAAVCLLAFTTGAAASDPPETVRSFYRWYLTQLNANREPIQDRAAMARYVSDRFLNEVEQKRKESMGLGSDPFISAQDVDELWAKNIFVSHVQTHQGQA